MNMTRKDYKLIAEAINKHTNIGQTPTINSDELIMELIHLMQIENPIFHGLKFFEAASARQVAWYESNRKQRESTLSWSERYYPGLTPEKHGANNSWMRDALSTLKDTGLLFIPDIGRTFNKQGCDVTHDLHFGFPSATGDEDGKTA
jgi:hypothetical protein